MTTNMAKDSEFYMSYRLSWQPSNIAARLWQLQLRHVLHAYLH